jgi:A/G-specific adenine glycosylase
VQWVGLLATRGTGSEAQLWLERGSGTLFGGLWNLPLAEGRGRAAARQLAGRLGLQGELSARRCGQVEHLLTHRLLQVELWALTQARAAAEAPEHLRAVALGALDGVGVSRLTHKALALLA